MHMHVIKPTGEVQYNPLSFAFSLLSKVLFLGMVCFIEVKYGEFICIMLFITVYRSFADS